MEQGNIQRCRVLYKNVKLSKQRAKRWQTYANNIGLGSFNEMATTSVIKQILSCLDKKNNIDKMAQNIMKAFDSLGENNKNALFEHFEGGCKENIKKYLNVKTDRTMWRRLNDLSGKVVFRFILTLKSQDEIYDSLCV